LESRTCAKTDLILRGKPAVMGAVDDAAFCLAPFSCRMRPGSALTWIGNRSDLGLLLTTINQYATQL
jgi:hypothetical protein